MGCCYSSENEDSDQDREERKLLLDPSSPPTKALNGAEPNYHSLPSARTDEQALLSSILAKTARWASQDWAWDSPPPCMLKTGIGGQTQDAGDRPRSVGRGTPEPSYAPVGKQGHDYQIALEISSGRESCLALLEAPFTSSLSFSPKQHHRRVCCRLPGHGAARVHGPGPAVQHPFGCAEQQPDPLEEAAAAAVSHQPAPPSAGQRARPPLRLAAGLQDSCLCLQCTFSDPCGRKRGAGCTVRDPVKRGGPWTALLLLSLLRLHPASPGPQPHCGLYSILTCY